MAQDNKINNSDESYDFLVLIKQYLHIIIFFIFISISFLGFIIYLNNSNTILGQISFSFATAFLTASLIDIFYNKITKENMEQLSAKILMLNKEVQNEILNNGKRVEILDCALESNLGNDLKDAINKSLIKKLFGYKNATRVNSSLSIILKNLDSGSNYFRDNFYYVEIKAKYNEKIIKDRLTFIYTDDNNLFTKESEVRGEKENFEVYLLPENIDKIKDDFFFDISDVRIDGEPLEEDKNGKDQTRNNKGEKNEKNTPWSMVKEYMIPSDKLNSNEKDQTSNNKAEKSVVKEYFHYMIPSDKLYSNSKQFAYIEYSINTVISKKEHVYFLTLSKAYNNFQILFDFSNTDILKCSVFHAFSETYVDRLDNGRKILISIRDWILPTTLICFVWYCKDEIPPQENKADKNGEEIGKSVENK